MCGMAAEYYGNDDPRHLERVTLGPFPGSAKDTQWPARGSATSVGAQVDTQSSDIDANVQIPLRPP